MRFDNRARDRGPMQAKVAQARADMKTLVKRTTKALTDAGFAPAATTQFSWSTSTGFEVIQYADSVLLTTVRVDYTIALDAQPGTYLRPSVALKQYAKTLKAAGLQIVDVRERSLMVSA